MPEGDTIHRAAQRLAILTGAIVRDAGAHPRTQVPAERLEGFRVVRVEARAKHLLIWLRPPEADGEAAGDANPGRRDVALYTHMRMTGSWRVFSTAQESPKPRASATCWLRTDDWVAACFNAPVCQVLSASQVQRHPVLSALGPDLVTPTADLGEARRRLDLQADRPLLDVLLDQRVFAGVGNVYKSELCFLHRVHPLTKVEALSGDVREALLRDAAKLLARNAAPGAGRRTTTPAGSPTRLYVYGRTGKPCLRCGTRIQSAALGDPARRTNWCPQCQPPPPEC